LEEPLNEPAAYWICSTCDEVVTDPHVHNLSRHSHPVPIEQRTVAGLDLTPLTLCVVVYAAWIDEGMREIYNRHRPYHPSVGLS
jgi:hypothetical protein